MLRRNGLRPYDIRVLFFVWKTVRKSRIRRQTRIILLLLFLERYKSRFLYHTGNNNVLVLKGIYKSVCVCTYARVSTTVTFKAIPNYHQNWRQQNGKIVFRFFFSRVERVLYYIIFICRQTGWYFRIFGTWYGPLKSCIRKYFASPFLFF